MIKGNLIDKYLANKQGTPRHGAQIAPARRDTLPEPEEFPTDQPDVNVPATKADNGRQRRR